ncbi:MAG: hydrogenase maturation protease, partial [Lutibacter sp.]
MDQRPPGTIGVLYPKFAADFPSILSAHDVGLKDMMEALEFQDQLPKIILVTVSIKEMIPMTITLTGEVQNNIKKLTTKILEILNKITIKKST